MSDDRQAKLALLDTLMAAFNAKDVDTIVSHFTEDGEFLLAAGADPDGKLFKGRDTIAAALRERFAAVPDIQWLDGESWVFGDKGLSEWHVSGTLPGGGRLDCRGCDLWEFRGGQVSRKDTYYKQVNS